MFTYIKDCLTPILGDDVSDDIIEYISSMKNEEDYEEFMQDIVDNNNKIHVEMYNKLKTAHFSANNSHTSSKKKGNKKPNQSPNTSANHNTSDSSTSSIKSPDVKNKKTKFVNFYANENRDGLKKGRHPCECQATKHELINNCTECGRIVCAQEGSGPCLFCDSMVCTRMEMDMLNSNSKDSDRLHNHLMDKKKSKDWEKAVESRNRLMSTDKMGAVKNKVFDDQNDYFDIHGKWLTDEEQGSIKSQYRNYQERVHKSRNDLKIALDFASRTVNIENTEEKYKTHLLKGVNKLLDTSDKRFPKNLFDGDKGKLISEIVKLMETQKLTNNIPIRENPHLKETNALVTPNNYRIANSDFLESVDKGQCLSMHQPWASLLVAGIKIHEGRTWRSDHRGRLWIAAAAKEPEDDVILTCEEIYRVLYDDKTLEFPKKYPVGCLLGCVFVEDCLDQETYRARFPNGESESPFVFICSNPVILPMFYPMQGQHKIFSINKDVHKMAKTALLSSRWL